MLRQGNIFNKRMVNPTTPVHGDTSAQEQCILGFDFSTFLNAFNYYQSKVISIRRWGAVLNQ